MNEWSMRQALFCLIGSTLFTLTTSTTGYFLWKKHRQERLQDPKFQIQTIVQTGPEKGALKTAYLAELLDLSIDRPTALYALDCKKAKRLLLSSPLISQARVKKMPPSALYIDYEVRKPFAQLADYKNVAIDSEGHLFPIAPFFSPKNLPEIYLGISNIQGWKIGEKNPHFLLALEILRVLESAPWKEGLLIKRLDVSNAFAPSLGQREIVLFTEEELFFNKNGKEIVCAFPKILRLAPKDYPQQLANFFSLRRAMTEDYQKQIVHLKEGARFTPRIIDLRIPQLAFVEKG